jgi:hypothetical protein
MIKKILLAYSFIVILCQVQSQTVADFDVHLYNTVTIGTQVWIKENLKVTHFNNGYKILYII